MLLEVKSHDLLTNVKYQEIAIRVMRTAHELSMRTVAIFSNEDRLSMHRYKVSNILYFSHVCVRVCVCTVWGFR